MGVKSFARYKDIYRVTKDGKVFSLDKTVRQRNRWGEFTRTYKGKERRQSVDKHGYKCVHLSRGGRTERFLVSRLVAEVHIPNPLNLPVVKHLDNNKLNNNVSNLQWATWSDNSKQAYSDGLTTHTFRAGDTSGEKSYRAKLTEKAVLEIRSSPLSHKELARIYRVHPSTICDIRHYKLWKHI